MSGAENECAHNGVDDARAQLRVCVCSQGTGIWAGTSLRDERANVPTVNLR